MDTIITVAGLAAFVAVSGYGAWLIRWAWVRREQSGFVRALAAMVGLVLFAGVPLALFWPITTRCPVSPNARAICITNMNRLSRAMLMYAGDNDERTPLSNWGITVAPYAQPSDFACPFLADDYGYAVNDTLVGAGLGEFVAHNTALLFDGPGGKNSIGDRSSIRWRHDVDRAVFGYTDGHVQTWIRSEFPGFQIAR
jgi:hypothetical protein